MATENGTNKRAMILATLGDYQVWGWSSGQIAKHLNLNTSLVGYHLRRLEDSQMVYRTPHKTWQVNRYASYEIKLAIQDVVTWGNAKLKECGLNS